MCLIQIFNQFLIQPIITLMKSRLNKKREMKMKLCRGHILNALSDRLYDLYTIELSAKAIWNILEFKYQAEEEGTKKFLISKYVDYKFMDDKSILA
ncbi:hypothetical protein MUK42_34435 [Musa troglodytarum]|uniref:Uncharacterized protein n=1 Tax=Musa troglodytarum TaxID=320322 RepID=A0A9E7EKM3_9LILI|nr:hypothetical protein MUK42_34435 [Musa troglodytarum]